MDRQDNTVPLNVDHSHLKGKMSCDGHLKLGNILATAGTWHFVSRNVFGFMGERYKHFLKYKQYLFDLLVLWHVYMHIVSVLAKKMMMSVRDIKER
jgi:hypothetical protein